MERVGINAGAAHKGVCARRRCAAWSRLHSRLLSYKRSHFPSRLQLCIWLNRQSGMLSYQRSHRRSGMLSYQRLRLLSHLRSRCGAASVGVLLLFAVSITAMMLVCEFIYAFSAKQTIDIELSRAANTAVDLAMSDAHRQDRLLVLDADVAYEQFYSYLYNDMGLSPRLESRPTRGGGIAYSLAIDSLVISDSPPGLRVTATVALHPVFLGRAMPVPIRFTVRGSSINRRID
ncbi:MAG: hypothetical protein FWH01_13350 [Oscillospiraceae bacterium]|nr:hypothetical protein [Oscillospiraceae bacterium]